MDEFVLFLPELRLLLRSFDTDTSMSSLRVALDPEAVKPFLTSGLAIRKGDGESITKCKVRVRQYVPRRKFSDSDEPGWTGIEQEIMGRHRCASTVWIRLGPFDGIRR